MSDRVKPLAVTDALTGLDIEIDLGRGQNEVNSLVSGNYEAIGGGGTDVGRILTELDTIEAKKMVVVFNDHGRLLPGIARIGDYLEPGVRVVGVDPDTLTFLTAFDEPEEEEANVKAGAIRFY